MNHSESISAVLLALARAKLKFLPVLKTKSNDHFKAKYANLAGHLEAIDAALTENGLYFSQGTSVTEHGGIIVNTRVTHIETGEWVGCQYPVSTAGQTPQQIGSALTYARRYSIANLFGLAAEDDDGNAASTVAADKRTRLINKGIEKARNGEYDEWQACLTKSERILLGKDALEKIAGEAA